MHREACGGRSRPSAAQRRLGAVVRAAVEVLGDEAHEGPRRRPARRAAGQLGRWTDISASAAAPRARRARARRRRAGLAASSAAYARAERGPLRPAEQQRHARDAERGAAHAPTPRDEVARARQRDHRRDQHATQTRLASAGSRRPAPRARPKSAFVSPRESGELVRRLVGIESAARGEPIMTLTTAGSRGFVADVARHERSAGRAAARACRGRGAWWSWRSAEAKQLRQWFWNRIENRKTAQQTGRRAAASLSCPFNQTARRSRCSSSSRFV